MEGARGGGGATTAKHPNKAPQCTESGVEILSRERAERSTSFIKSTVRFHPSEIQCCLSFRNKYKLLEMCKISLTASK